MGTWLTKTEWLQNCKGSDSKPYVPTEEELAEIARQEKIAQIQSQIITIDAEFATLDYVGIKIATGRATVEEYKTEIDRMNELATMKDALEEELLSLWWKYYIYYQYC